MKITPITFILFIHLLLFSRGFGTELHTDSSKTDIQGSEQEEKSPEPDSLTTYPLPATSFSTPDTQSSSAAISTPDFQSLSAASSISPDTSSDRESMRQTYLIMEKKRGAEHYHNDYDQILYDPYHVGSSAFFLADGTALSEVLRAHPLITTARYGLSTSMNRFLLFGAVAPVNRIYSGNLLYDYNTSIVKGTDQASMVDISEIAFKNFGDMQLSYHPFGIVSPEAVLFWENGVFDERLLFVRLTRPLSKNLTLSAFTNSRYFKGGSFSHSSDIRSFYSSISDSSYISDKGYNPLTDEFMAGLAFLWAGQDQPRLRLKITYGDLNHETSIDRPVKLRERLEHALYHRYPFELDAGASWKMNNRFFFDIESRFREEPFICIIGDSAENRIVPKRHDAKDRELDFALGSGIELSGKDSLGLCYGINRTSYTLFDQSDAQSFLHRPELFYNYHFRLSGFDVTARASAGLSFFNLNDSSETAPVWNAGATVKKDNVQYRAYFQQDNIPFIINYDSLRFDQVLLDSYYKAGAESYWKWKNADLLLGYQLVYGPDSVTVHKSWPLGIVPYEQPVSSFVIAPSIGRWHGLAFKSSINISDSKPTFKIHGALSFLAHPVNTQEYIDASLTFDYWSGRDPVSYSGFTDWGRPVLNMGLEATVHIRSFRLFYKVDNILNRRFAYLPGYYTPGITFRWGFNWFLQK